MKHALLLIFINSLYFAQLNSKSNMEAKKYFERFVGGGAHGEVYELVGHIP